MGCCSISCYGYHRNRYSIQDRYGAGWFVLAYITDRVIGNRRGTLRRSSQYRGVHDPARRRRLRGGRAHIWRIPHIAKLQIGVGRSTVARGSVNPVRLPHRLGWWILCIHRRSFVQRLSQILNLILWCDDYRVFAVSRRFHL